MFYRVRNVSRLVFFSVILVAGALHFAWAQETDIPWKDKQFGVVLTDETLFNVFEMIGVENSIPIQPPDRLKDIAVTRDFSTFSLEGTFAFLLKEYNLDYEFNKEDNYIRVFRKEIRELATRFFRIGNIDPVWFQQKLTAFGFWKKEYVIDTETGLLIAKDTRGNLETLSKYINELVKTQGFLDPSADLEKALALGSKARNLIQTARLEIVSIIKKIDGLPIILKKPSSSMQSFEKRMEKYEEAINEINKGKDEIEKYYEKISSVCVEVEAIYRDLSKEANAHFAMVKAKEIEGKMNLTVDYLENAEKIADELKNKFVRKQVIKFIPLRYASVVARTVNFMGNDIQVPGIDETLKDLFGIGAVEKPIEEEDRARGLRAKIKQMSLSLSEATKEMETAKENETGLGAKTTWTPEPGKILFDATKNGIIVKDYPEKIKEFEEIIRELDREVPLIQLDAIILTASTTFAKSLGFRYSGLKTSGDGSNRAQIQGGQGGSVAIPGTLQNPADGITSIPTIFSPIVGMGGSAAASLFFKGSSYALNIQISAAEEEGIARVLSNPRVVTFDNQEAMIQSGQTVNVKVSGGGYESGATVKEINTGIALRVTPHIIYAKDQFGELDYSKVEGVKMQVDAENSSFNAASVDGIPGTDTRNIQTQVMVADNTTIILGGLHFQSNSKKEDGIPLLKDIPFLGFLFRGKSKEDTRSELLFFITPKVLSNKIITAPFKFNPALKNNEFILKSLENADRLLLEGNASEGTKKMVE
ncbi:hypothetical protein ACFL0M_03255 [Thermodesulfobacteriota bacterium]